MLIDRLDQFLIDQKIKRSAFERTVGMSNGLFGKNLKAKANIGSEFIESILKNYPILNPKWLLTGEGPMLRTLPDDLLDGVNEEKGAVETQVKEPAPGYAKKENNLIETLTKQLEVKDEQIKEKDVQLKAKDEQINNMQGLINNLLERLK